VDYEEIDGIRDELVIIRDDLAGVHSTLDAGIASTWSDRVAHSLGSFGHGWVDGRKKITSEVETLAAALSAVVAELAATDSQLGGAAPRPGRR
jgi:hypothetical protein